MFHFSIKVHAFPFEFLSPWRRTWKPLRTRHLRPCPWPSRTLSFAWAPGGTTWRAWRCGTWQEPAGAARPSPGCGLALEGSSARLLLPATPALHGSEGEEMAAVADAEVRSCFCFRWACELWPAKESMAGKIYCLTCLHILITSCCSDD